VPAAAPFSSDPRNGIITLDKSNHEPINGCEPRAKAAVVEDWLLWQLADSAFPTGGFAHSGGLEAAWQHWEVRTSAELEGFLRASLVQLGRGSLPFMMAAYEKVSGQAELNSLCDSFITNHVANRASRLQGQAFLASASRIFGLARLEQACGAVTSPFCGHLGPVFGAVARALNLERTQAGRMFLFWHLRGWLASAVRLGLFGPLEAQTLQHTLGKFAEDILDQCAGLQLAEIAQTSPLLDLWQGAQDRLYSRLFQS